MNAPKFEWDENKNRTNRNKHKVSFEEAKTVFYDENARLIRDPDHSSEEDKFVILGLSSNLKLLVVVHCYRTDKDIIRIISARKATKTEKQLYERRK
jgi:uncharacterized DUF497 family protein